MIKWSRAYHFVSSTERSVLDITIPSINLRSSETKLERFYLRPSDKLEEFEKEKEKERKRREEKRREEEERKTKSESESK